MINISPPNSHHFPYFPAAFTIYSTNMGLETEGITVLWGPGDCKKYKFFFKGKR